MAKHDAFDEEDFAEKAESANISLEEMIEKKFRDVDLETKIIAFACRRSYNCLFTIRQSAFTIEPFRTVFRIVHKARMEFTQDILLNYLKNEVDKDQYPIYKSFIKRIYEEALVSVSMKNIEALCKKLMELLESRELMKVVGQTVSNIKHFNLKQTKKKFHSVIYSSSAINKNIGGEYLEDYEERAKVVQQRHDNPELYMGIPTGIAEFDKVSGGLMRGEFGIIIAGTGVGKSIALGNFAVNAWVRGFSVLFVSLEMSKHQVEFRFDSRLAKIKHDRFRKGSLDSNEKRLWAEKMERLRRKQDNFLHVSCLHRGCCALEIEEEALKLESKYGRPVDLIVVDYINLMVPNDLRGDKRDWKGQSEIAWDLKSLCMDFGKSGIPIWTANQITDEGAKAKGKLETHHLKYARGIAETAPVIVALSQSADDALCGKMKMWILKCRDFQSLKTPIELFPKYDMMILNRDIIKDDIEGYKKKGEGNESEKKR